MYSELPLSELKKHPNNPRFIRDRQFNILVESIRNNPDYFKARPLIISNRTGENIIIAGNQRYEAARHLKMNTVPCFILENLTEEREKEIMIRDNISNGEWDFDILANEFMPESLAVYGLDLYFLNQPEEKAEKPLKMFYEITIVFTKQQAEYITNTIKEFSSTKLFKDKREKSENKNINGLALYMIINEYINQQTNV